MDGIESSTLYFSNVLKKGKIIMKFTKPIELNDFLRTVDECEGEVWFESPRGDRFVLKSVFSRYIAMSALLTEKGDELLLYCQLAKDESKFFKYLDKYPDVI